MKSILQLVKTSQGYSIIQDGHEVNKVTSRSSKQKQYSSMPKKFLQQIFTIHPYTYIHEPQWNQKYVIVPAKSQWFNMSQVHQIQRKALPQWFKTKKVVFGAVKPDKFQKNEELYKKYRNYIIDLSRNQYLSPTKARKGLAGDVCAILRIHSFLQKNGLINYVYSKNKVSKKTIDSQNCQNNQNKPNLVKRKDCIDKDKLIFDKHFDKDHIELLKKITKKFRPNCYLCEGICGIIWYEYEEELYLKTFEQIKSQPLNNNFHISEHNGAHLEQQRKQSQYEPEVKKTIIHKNQKPIIFTIKLCSSCFSSNSLPAVLSMDDFKKHSILDNKVYEYQEPREKKKINQQNKLIQTMEKNKLSLKKTAQTLRISQKQVEMLLLCLPLIKIQKLARIDQEDEEQIVQNKNGVNGGNRVEKKLAKQQNTELKNTKEKQLLKQKEESVRIRKNYISELQQIQKQEKTILQQFVQFWLLKITTKLTKISDWEKSTQWFARSLLNDEKNNLAEVMKNQHL